MINLVQDLERFLPDRQCPRSLGCTGCKFVGRCGGIQDRTHRFSCFDRCKSQCKDTCGNACPYNDSFDARVGQVGGLELDNVPFGPLRRISKLPLYVPLIDHEYLFEGAIPFETVAIPLRRLIRVQTRDVRFSDARDLRSALGLHADAKVLALGVAKDANLENLWGIRYQKTLFQELRQLQLAGVTAPNYSSFLDQPRTEDMVNQKRTLLYAYHLQKAGIPAALHWNIYFERDSALHEAFLKMHEEYDTICVEFGSGLRSLVAANFFVDQLLVSVAKIARPLRLITKGGIRYLPQFCKAFSSVTFVDSRPFHLARSRRRISSGNNGELLEVREDARTKQEVRNLFEANAHFREKKVKELSSVRVKSGR